MKTKIINVILSLCLFVSIIVGFISSSTISSAVYLSNDYDEDHLDFVAPDIIDDKEIESNRYVGRVKEDEKDLFTFVFKNEDGSNTMRVFSHPVKFIDEKGDIQDFSLKIEQTNDGCFSPARHLLNTTFGSSLSEGISLEYDGINIVMKSTDINDSDIYAILSEDSKKVIYTIDAETSFVYSMTYKGIKEDIIVNEYTGQTEYSFILHTHGLHPISIGDSIFLADDKDDIKASIGDIIIFSADEKHNSFGRILFDTISVNSEYIFTIVVDADYLSDEKTQYPITIDPTISINYGNNGAGAIEDVTINSNAGTTPLSGSLYAGLRTTHGTSRILMRFPYLSLSGISANQITAATVELRDLMCQDDEDMYIECCIYNNSSPAWSESTSTTWTSVGSSYVGTALDSKLITFNNGNVSAQRYAFNILNLAKAWANGTQSPSKGVVFKATDTFENQTGNDINIWNKTFSSYNRDVYQPSLSITYSAGISRSLFYSKYDPTKYNNPGTNPPIGSNTDLIQYRMNCYGYAFGYILNGYANINISGGYKQQPGEFASTSNKSNTVINTVYNNPTATMNNVVNNMQLDASRLGFTITEYTTASSTVDQFGTSSRLIAVVTGIDDYHFYVQHNDGTWSHKPGSEPVTNKSFSSNTILTNENIKSRANEGSYANGILKFFVISKTAVMDYPHSLRCCYSWPCSHTQNTLYLKEQAGDYLQCSKTKYTGGTTARIDYAKDHDVYCFTPATTRTYSITTTCNSSADLDCDVYDNAGAWIMYSNSIGQVNISMQLIAGQKYFFDIYNCTETVTDYTFTIS